VSIECGSSGVVESLGSHLSILPETLGSLLEYSLTQNVDRIGGGTRAEGAWTWNAETTNGRIVEPRPP